MADLDPSTADLDDRDRRAIEEALAAIGEDPSIEGLLRRYSNVLYEDGYEIAIDEHVDSYRNKLRRRARETADGAGSARISKQHVDHAAMSLAFRQRDSGLLQTILGVAASVAGTTVGLLVGQFGASDDAQWSGVALALTAAVGLVAVTAAVAASTALWLRRGNN